MIDVPEKDRLWLEAFFGGENEVHWQDLQEGTVKPHWAHHILPWLRFLSDSPLRRPIVLPVFDESGPARWYGLAETPSGVAQLRDELLAFLGPTYSDFVGIPTVLAESDRREAALIRRFGPVALTFATNPRSDRGQLEREVSLLCKTVARRPEASNRGRRPFGLIRSDFDAALLAGNEAHSNALIEEMAATGRLTADQRKCLHIRQLAGLGRSEDLARDHSLITAVMDLQLPPQTLVDVTGALFKTYVAPGIDADETPSQTTDRFRSQVARRYGPLFRERKGIRDPEVLLCFLLFEASSDRPDLGRCRAILGTYPEGSEGRAWAEKFVTWLEGRDAQPASLEPKQNSESKETQVRLAIGDEDYRSAVAACKELLPGIWAFRTLLRCAVDANDASLAAEVRELIEQYLPQLRPQLEARDQHRLDRLRSLAERAGVPAPENDWISWARWIELANPSHSESQEILKIAAPKWSPVEYALRPELCDVLAKLIDEASPRASTVYRLAFPDLVDFFVDRPIKPVVAYSSIYLTLIRVIAYSDAATADELNILSNVVRALLETAPSKNVYGEVVDELAEVARTNLSLARLDWALDLCEILVVYPAPNREARLRVLVEVSRIVHSVARRLSIAQALIFKQLADEYGSPELGIDLALPEAAAEEANGNSNYSGQIAIYTLSERSAATAKATLSKLIPNARIVVNSDFVGTDSLKSLAKNSDLFVFVWKKATHAAFQFVRDLRGLENIVQPEGGGSASIVRATLKAVAQESTNLLR